MSSQYEHKIANGIYEETPQSVMAYRCGYSGNSKHAQPDVLVTTYSGNKGLELKGPIQSDNVYIDADDLHQLVACQNANTDVYLIVKFPRYEPVTIKYYGHMAGDRADEWNNMSVAERFAALAPAAFNARVTDSGSLAMSNPKDTDWPSTVSGKDDVTKILDDLGLPHDGAVHVER